MKVLSVCILVSLGFSVMPVDAQITVEVEDLQFEAGARREYLTHQGNLTIVNGLILGIGGPRVWNFSSGPSDEIYEYEVMAASDSPVAGPFGGAELAELLTIDSDQSTSWTFFEVSPQGRSLHGFHNTISNPSFPVVRFDSPFVDYPSTIDYEDQWTASPSYQTQQDIGGGQVFPMAVDVTISSFVDAYGTLTLPSLGTVEVLRVNELSFLDAVVDVGGIPVPLTRTFVRSHTWISKEFGIVAQMTSEAGAEAPPVEFGIASRFLRLSSSVPPPPVKQLEILTLVRGSKSSATVTWCSVLGRTYAIEVSDDLTNWQGIASSIEASAGGQTSFTESKIPSGIRRRFYRVREE